MTFMKLQLRAGELNFFQQWVKLGFALLTLAGFIAWTQFHDYQSVGALEADRLTKQALIVEKNIVPRFWS